MRYRKLHIFFSFLLLLIVLALGQSKLAAEPALQPSQPTASPVPSDSDTEIPEVLTLIPVPTSEIDPEALILEDGWQNPYNLSRSGAASSSQMVIDSNGTRHILWLDQVEGFGYTFGAGDQWSQPTTAEFPFYTRRFFPDLPESAQTPLFNPKLVADGRGQILAFWIGDDGILYYSSVPSSGFTNYDSWISRSALSANTLVLSAATGSDGTVHTAYIRRQDSEERPAGVYYRQLNSAGAWQNSILLYPSRYLRSVPADVANIQVFASDNGNLYIAWDDTLKQQIYFASSSDNGLSWDSIQIIDRRAREDDDAAAGPSKIVIGADDEQLHLTWRGGHEQDHNCSQYVINSTDGGATWSERRALTSLPSCFVSAQFFIADETLFLLGTIEEESPDRNNQVTSSYLLAWDGTRWSEPQIQVPLSRYSNPETFQPVRLDCHLAVGQGTEIAVIGCDSADGGDIWRLSRETGSVEEWFPLPPVWQGPNEIRSGNSTPKEVQLVASSDGTVHAIWNAENYPGIFHSGWDGAIWSPSQEIVQSPRGNALSLSAASANDRLFLTWKDPELGIQFSQASLSNANQWTEPISLVEEIPEASSPSIVADAGGNVFVAFTEQFNETRGVYLLHSADAGETWSSPLQVFDGAAAGWDMVERPLLARTDNGQMHLMWTRRSLPPDSIPLGLAYSRSEDLGQSWTDEEIVVEAETYWNQIIDTGERSVHRFWAEESGGRDIIWHSHSLDGGLTWSQSEQVTGLFNRGGVTAATDPVSRLHLITLDNGQLSDLVWQDNSWIADEGSETTLGNNGNLAASANLRGELVVSYIDPQSAEGESAGDSNLYALWRTLDLPEELPTPLPTLTPTRPPLTPTPTTTPEPTPTVFFSTEQEQTGLGAIPGMGGLPISFDIVLAFLPVLLIIGLGLIIGIRIIRKR